MTHAIRDKYEKIIKDLNEDIKLLKAGGVSTGVSGGKISIGSDVDAQKLHQRLKESFKEQISVFREGVYLLTGYKIDMIAGEQADRPRFKVRSMYAEVSPFHSFNMTIVLHLIKSNIFIIILARR